MGKSRSAYLNITIIAFFYLFILSICADLTESKNHAVIKSCSGCALGRLPKVKDFIYEESQFYPIDFIYSGGDPHLEIVDDYGTVIKDYSLMSMSRESIMKLLEKEGFSRYES